MKSVHNNIYLTNVVYVICCVYADLNNHLISYANFKSRFLIVKSSNLKMIRLI